jgi:hypothetical protein
MGEERRREFARALQLHLRYRFDPDGLDSNDRETLRETARLHLGRSVPWR